MFQWIFVLVAGAILLGFLINFGLKQSRQAESSSSTEVSKALETIVRSIERSSDTFKRITIPPTTLRFSCDDTGSNYRVQGSSATTNLQYNIIFSPTFLSGNEILTWTRDWNVPFKIASFLYLTNKKVQYVFVMDKENQTSFLLNDFPKNFTYTVIDPNDPNSPPLSSFQYNNYNQYRFIYINQDPSANLPPPPESKDNVSIISTVSPAPPAFPVSPDQSESVYFYPYTPSGLGTPQESFYLRRETLYAALFSQDLNTYLCNMQKARERFNILIDLALLWIQNVSTEIGAGTCHDLLNNPSLASPGILQHLDKIKTELAQLQLQPSSGGSDTPHAQTILSEAQQVEQLNDDLARASCPQLY